MKEIDRKILIKSKLNSLIAHISSIQDEAIEEDLITEFNNFLEELEKLYDYSFKKEFEIGSQEISIKKKMGIYFFENSLESTTTAVKENINEEKYYDKMKVMRKINALLLTIESIEKSTNKNNN